MLITVLRTNKTIDGIFGNLMIDSDPFKCVTMENLLKQIPPGVYSVKWMYSDHFEQIMPHILVPGRSAIEAHWANYPIQLEGCISVGTEEELAWDRLDESKDAWIDFVEAILNQPNLTIKIVEDYGA